MENHHKEIKHTFEEINVGISPFSDKWIRFRNAKSQAIYESAKDVILNNPRINDKDENEIRNIDFHRYEQQIYNSWVNK